MLINTPLSQRNRRHSPPHVPLRHTPPPRRSPSRDVFVEEDTSSCVGVAQSLMVLRGLYGAPRRTLAHGRAAHAVTSALTQLAADQQQKDERVSTVRLR